MVYAICAILVLSGYFWGKIINKFLPLLKKVNTTALGVFIVLGLFQVVTFLGVPNNWNVDIYQYALIVFLVAGPILCLCLRVNVLPHWNDVIALVFAVILTFGICCISTTMNTNNLYFDSTFYLSRVIDSSTANTMAHLSSYNGVPQEHIFALYDYQGFYYLWGMILRLYHQFRPLLEPLTPMYIWPATLLYGMVLGCTIAMSIQVLLPKLSWKNAAFGVLVVAILSPYYLNYFNTTLAFFGNTYRTVIIGAAMLLCYCYLKEKNNWYYLLLSLIFCAGLNVSSSCFFIFIFVSVGLFFGLLTQKEQAKYAFPFFFIANLPLVYNFYILANDWATGIYIPFTNKVIFAYMVVLVLSFFWEKLSERTQKIFKWVLMACYLLVFLGLAYLSTKLGSGMYGYALFYELRSANDMILNYVSWSNSQELLRNIILWILLVASLLRYKNERSFKMMLYSILLLFINPLVCPFIATYATQQAYCRIFDILINPFTLTFFVIEFLEYIQPKWLAITGVSVMACVDGYLGFETATTPFYSILTKNKEGYHWQTKVTDDQWDMYTYIIANGINNPDDRPLILSQDVEVKAYVSDIQLVFSTVDIRNTVNLSDFDATDPLNRAIVYFNPLAVVANEPYNGVVPDYTTIRDVILSSDADYVLMRYPMAVLDEKGYYIEAYKYAEDICTEVYKNDTWVLLKIEK